MTDSTPSIPRLVASYDPAELHRALDTSGCCVVEGAVAGSVMDLVAEEMRPHTEATDRGDNDFAGAGTRRTGMLLKHSETFRTHLARHQIILDAGDHVLGHAPVWNLSFAHYFELFNGEPSQLLHRDTWKYGAPPFPFEVDVNALWAVTDFTEANGATRVVPGSHLWDNERRPEPAEAVSAEMSRGSVLLYTGLVYHGGGAHTGPEVRLAVNTQHNVGWLNQTERMLLEYPPEVAARWDDELLRFIGYQTAGPALGHWRNAEDPFTAIDEVRGGSSSTTR